MVLHGDCWIELGGCTTLGCVAQGRGGADPQQSKESLEEEQPEEKGEDLEVLAPRAPISVRTHLVVVVALTICAGAYGGLSATPVGRYAGLQRTAVTMGWLLAAFPTLLLLSGLRCGLHTRTLGKSLRAGFCACGFVTLIWGIYGVAWLVSGDLGQGGLVLGLSWCVLVFTGGAMHSEAADYYRDLELSSR